MFIQKQHINKLRPRDGNGEAMSVLMHLSQARIRINVQLLGTAAARAQSFHIAFYSRRFLIEFITIFVLHFATEFLARVQAAVGRKFAQAIK